MSQEELAKDAATLYAMGAIFCESHHHEAAKNGHGVCEACENVIAYSVHRTALCPFEHKGNCKDCEIHCYRPEMRAGIREIMAFGAPRMVYRHPLMTAQYVAKKIRNKKAAKAERQG